MKTLLLLRHGKSSWAEDGLKDFDRPLKKRGQHDAEKTAHWLSAQKLLPQLVLCSSALRAKETAASFLKGLHSSRISIQYKQDLYLAPVSVLLEEIASIDKALDTAMVIGHNPGFEELLYTLSQTYRPFPTCGLAAIRLESWASGKGSLELLHTPKSG